MNVTLDTNNRALQQTNAVTGTGTVGAAGAADGASTVGKVENLTMTQGGVSLPTAGKVGGLNVLLAPRNVDADVATGVLASFLEGLKENSNEPDPITASTANLRREELLKAERQEFEAAQTTYDVYQMMRDMNDSNAKRADFVSNARIEQQKAQSKNATERAQSAMEPKKIGFMILQAACQVGSAALNATHGTAMGLKEGGGATFKAFQAKLKSSTLLQVGFNFGSKALDLGANLSKMFENGDQADERTIKQSQAEAVRGMLATGKSIINDTAEKIYDMTNTLEKSLQKIYENEMRTLNGIQV